MPPPPYLTSWDTFSFRVKFNFRLNSKDNFLGKYQLPREDEFFTVGTIFILFIFKSIKKAIVFKRGKHSPVSLS